MLSLEITRAEKKAAAAGVQLEESGSDFPSRSQSQAQCCVQKAVVVVVGYEVE